MLERPLPRFVEVRRLANGDDGKSGRSATLNALFDEWNDRRKGEPIEQAKIARYGTIDWLFRQYKTEKAYTEKVSPRSRPDYERIRCRHLVGSCEPRVYRRTGRRADVRSHHQTSLRELSVGQLEAEQQLASAVLQRGKKSST